MSKGMWKMYACGGMTAEAKKEFIAAQTHAYKVSDWGNYIIVYSIVGEYEIQKETSSN